MELEAKLMEESIRLANKLDAMNEESEGYGVVLDRYQTVKRMLDDETKRINANQQMELEAKKLEVEKDKIELDSMQKRLNADIEEEKLKQQKKAHGWDIAKKVIGGIVTVGANAATVYLMIRFNNSGETLTSFENKFIFPDRLK